MASFRRFVEVGGTRVIWQIEGAPYFFESLSYLGQEKTQKHQTYVNTMNYQGILPHKMEEHVSMRSHIV